MHRSSRIITKNNQAIVVRDRFDMEAGGKLVTEIMKQDGSFEVRPQGFDFEDSDWLEIWRKLEDKEA